MHRGPYVAPSGAPYRTHPCIRAYGKCDYENCKYRNRPYELCVDTMKGYPCKRGAKCRAKHTEADAIAASSGPSQGHGPRPACPAAPPRSQPAQARPAEHDQCIQALRASLEDHDDAEFLRIVNADLAAVTAAINTADKAAIIVVANLCALIGSGKLANEDATRVRSARAVLEFVKHLPDVDALDDRAVRKMPDIVGILWRLLAPAELDYVATCTHKLTLRLAASGDPRIADLETRVTAHQHARQHQQTQLGHHPAAAPSYISDGIQLDARPVLCCEADFDDERPREAIQQALQPIIVDRPIPAADGMLHVTQTFKVFREDFVASLRRAVQLVREFVTPVLHQPPHELAKALHSMRGKDKEGQRDVKLYTNVKLVGVSVHRLKGLVYTFQLQASDFQASKGANGKEKYQPNWDRALQNGNAILLSRTGFAKKTPLIVGSIVRKDAPFIGRDELLGGRGRGGAERGRGSGQRGGRDGFGPDPLVTQGLFDVLIEDGALAAQAEGASTFMALESSAFFVPYHSTLNALRNITEADLPLMPFLLGVESTHQYPTYLRHHHLLQIGKAVKLDTADDHLDVHLGEHWDRCTTWTAALEKELAEGPGTTQHALDPTQAAALRHIFSHTVAVVQGTPGTGKTFIGAKFAQILIANYDALRLSGPILCVCYTNHAVDAFLRDLMQFGIPEEDIVRIGGRSKDPEIAERLALNKKIRRGPGMFLDRYVEGLQKLSVDRDVLLKAKTTSDAGIFNILNAFHLDQHDAFRVLTEGLHALHRKNQQQQASVQRQLHQQQQMFDRYAQECHRVEIHNLEQLRKRRRVLEQATAAASAAEQNLRRGLAKHFQEPLAHLTDREVTMHTRQLVAPVQTDVADLQDSIRQQQSFLKELQNRSKTATTKKGGKKRGKKAKGESGKKTEDPSATPVAENPQHEETTEAINAMTADLTEKQQFLNDILPCLLELEKAVSLQAKQLTTAALDHVEQCLLQLQQHKTDIDALQLDLDRVRAQGLPDGMSQLQHWRQQLGRVQYHPPAPVYAPPTPDARADGDADDVQPPTQGENGRDCALNDDDDDQAGMAVVADLSEAQELNRRDHADLTRLQTLVPSFERALALPAQQREEVICRFIDIALRGIARRQLNVIEELEKKKVQAERERDHQAAGVLRRHKIIGATTTGCAEYLRVLRSVQPAIVIVEEAAEVLEAHVLGCLTASVQHLVLIGDHKQLQPKVTEELILGRKKNLLVSLMERLVRIRQPFVTLTTQRRMHPDISHFTKDYYTRLCGPGDMAVEVQDHPRTLELPAPQGVVDERRVVVVNNPASTPFQQECKHPGLQSDYNAYESLFVVAVAAHLGVANPGRSITILLPYTGQLKRVHEDAGQQRLPVRSKLSAHGVRISTIDDYQGEESDFIVLSLVRTTDHGFEHGFLKFQNRACVALSRARLGMYIIGCVAKLQKCPNLIWKGLLDHAAIDGQVPDKFPAWCPQHRTALPFASPQERLGVQCPELCRAPLPDCAHLCAKVCHGGSSEHGQCMEACSRTGVQCKPPRPAHCLHACRKPCHDPCGKCTEPMKVLCPDCGVEGTDIPCHAVDEYRCKNPVEELGECGHRFTAPCFRWSATDTLGRGLHSFCKAPCGQALPCTHICNRTCHAGDDDDHTKAAATCQEKKKALHPKCKRHEVETVCTLPDAKVPPCAHPCGGQAPCGHPCDARCGGCPGSRHSCTQGKRMKEFPCGHSREVRCADYAKAICTELCPFTLACGHKCPGCCGSCGTSDKWVDHQPCQNNCRRVLPCGHGCKSSCGAKCRPCEEWCDFSCGHGTGCAKLPQKSRHKCRDCAMRERCQNPCVWACPHLKCQLRCYEPCTRLACDERCPVAKLLPCGHAAVCLGVCGEACPDFCRTCFQAARAKGDAYAPRERFVTQNVFLLEDEVDAFLAGDLPELEADASVGPNAVALRLVQLPCCNHLFLAGDLDKMIEVAAAPGMEIAAFRCPREACRKVLAADWYKRQSTCIKQRQADIAAMRQRIVDANEEDVKSKASTLDALETILLRLLPEGDARRDIAATLFDAIDDMPRPPLLRPAPRAEKPNQRKKREDGNDKATRESEEQHRLQRDARTELVTFFLHFAQSGRRQSLTARRIVEGCVTFYIGAHSMDEGSSDVLRQQVQAAEHLLFVAPIAMHTPPKAPKRDMAVDVLQRLFGAAALPTAADATRLVHKAHLAQLAYRLDAVLDAAAKWAEESSAAGGVSPATVPRQHNYADHRRFFEHQVAQARALVPQLPFFRGHGRPVFHPNPCLTSSCSAFQRFMSGLQEEGLQATGPALEAEVQLVFHGTAEGGILPICCRGFDVARRAGQSYGPGEYFGVQPDISSGYTKGTPKMLVCCALRRKDTCRNGTICVINNKPNTQYVVPLGVAEFSAAPSHQWRCTHPAAPADTTQLERDIHHLFHTVDASPTTDCGPQCAHLDAELRHLEQKYGAVQPPREFLLALSAALNVTSGHWYKCPNGHLYVIADCGGAMVEARCPECNAAIGGGDHRLLPSNASAAALLGGDNPAWPL